MIVKIPVKCVRLDKILNKYSEIKLIKYRSRRGRIRGAERTRKSTNKD